MPKTDAKASPAGATPNGSTKVPKPPNPVWRMMGLPNFRFKLPSRNWMIFLSVTGSWSAAVIYDRREKRRIQRKWTKLVEHIAQETIEPQQMPRRLTVYLSAPPADGLVAARDHFSEYIKPILVAAALDWDAIEGRKEGDVRAALAERIRKLRIKRGESSSEPMEEELQDVLEETRLRAGIKEWDGPGGDIVVGRHTWKEYVRGLHEGWLGPMDSPAPVEEEPVVPAAPTPEPALETSRPSDLLATDDASPTATEVHSSTEPEKPKEDEKKPKKKKQPLPYNTTADYPNSNLTTNCPQALGPSTVIPFPHLLGFWNFPIRMYRFLNRRFVADDIGRQTAAAVLCAYRPYHAPAESVSSTSAQESSDSSDWEQQGILAHDESEWHKTARKRNDDDPKERVWLENMVIDRRIGERMRKFELDVEAEERASRITDDKEGSWLKSLLPEKEKKKQWQVLADEVE